MTSPALPLLGTLNGVRKGVISYVLLFLHHVQFSWGFKTTEIVNAMTTSHNQLNCV